MRPDDAHCDDPYSCITCSDAAVPMIVASIDRDIGSCTDAAGAPHDVMLGLVPNARPGSRVLVHAGVALTIEPEGAP